jgi:hypothetical protein
LATTPGASLAASAMLKPKSKKRLFKNPNTDEYLCNSVQLAAQRHRPKTSARISKYFAEKMQIMRAAVAQIQLLLCIMLNMTESKCYNLIWLA